MAPERNERRRQNQVACHMCRARKLKCDQRKPCSSCTSRRWMRVRWKTGCRLLPDVPQYHQPKNTKRILLPPRDFALRVIDLYEEKLESAQQVMHIPTVRAKVQLLYEQSRGPRPGSQQGLIALLLAMSAHIGFWDTYQRNGLFQDVELAAKVSTVLAQQAMDAMNYARDSTTATMEAVQAATLLVFLEYHMEGFSMRLRLLQSTALAMARELRLHMIDAVQSKPIDLDQAAVIEIETGRKLWWYIACTDWLLAFDSGPTQGVYSVIPQQMRVKKPRNLNTDDFFTRDLDFERSNDAATPMAYYFLRIRLAEVCREAVDSMIMQQPEAVPYDKVYELDGKFCALTTSLPRFLQLDVGPETIKREFGDRGGSQIGLQRALANLMISVRRCKFHLPFLIRHKINPRYAFSRYACLESAQKLLEVRRVFLDDSSWQISSTLPLLGLYRFVFYAAMVLVMDLCINNPNDRTRLVEVRDAMQIVAETKSTNQTAWHFLHALRDVLSRHGISLPVENNSNVITPHQTRQEGTQSIPNDSISECRPMTGRSTDPVFDFSEFELLWPQNLVDDLFLDPHCWDGLINLDTRIM
ncbi:hypothetical protein M409DRAFT_18671 [Zasmidium cellare ATCC 36951]|uniref:Zn(2)-C6 fungal-type domain-containing protein n=1 Tax=Zasmidium cellare ATCC 36951 TaxID=1080233 RepID=A0A6A6CZH0_ZASCE|nr:uncharacterized protein M409DRAFT_18671 [Zasmidium cellare ATCC 36951]KAF2171558.1 hypothetical protein M409DRAFT_18671 [Zasmidium cellare ATCC 36951]